MSAPIDFPMFRKIVAAIREHYPSPYASMAFDFHRNLTWMFYRPHHYKEWPLPLYVNDNLERWS